MKVLQILLLATLFVAANAVDCNSTIITPFLNGNTSTISGGNLVLNVFSSIAYQSTVVSFVGANSAMCNSALNTYWTSTITVCENKLVSSMPLAFALTNCSFTRDEVGTSTTFTSKLKITTTQSVATSQRGLILTRTVETGATIIIAISSTLTANTTSQVYPPHILGGAITTQTFDVNNNRATLTLVTSVQYPYQMNNPQISTVAGFTSSITAPTVDSGTRATCANFAVNTPCVQTWSILVYRTTVNCASAQTLSASWTATLDAACHSSFTGNCVTPSPLSTTFNFATQSDDFCPRLIDTESSTATLKSYTSASYIQANEQQNFVFGARTYFYALVTSPIVIETLRVEKVTIVTGGTSAGQVMYNAAFTGGAAAYFASLGTSAGSSYSASPVSFAITDNSTTGASSDNQRGCAFNWVWGSTISNAAGDNPSTATVQVDLRIRFKSQSTVSEKLITLTTAQKKHISFQLTEDSASTAAAEVSVVGDSATVVGAAASVAEEASLPTGLVVAGIIGAVVAAIAGVVVAAAVYQAKKATTSKTATMV